MSHSLKIERTFQLASSPAEIWQSLVSPSLVRQYHYNCEVACVEAGSQGSDLQKCPTFQSGDILEYMEHRKVKFSTFDRNAGLDDLPRNYLHITYLLEPTESGVELKIIIENFMDNDNRFEHSKSGWDNMVAPEVARVLSSKSA